VRDGLLVCGMSVQAKSPGSALEAVADNDINPHGH